LAQPAKRTREARAHVGVRPGLFTHYHCKGR